MRIPALRAALRIARRDALRAPARSILVIAMIGLPILGLTSADVLLRTAQLSATEELDRELGAADALVLWSGEGGPIEQDPAGLKGGWGTAPGSTTEQERTPPTEQDLLRALPPASTVVSRRSVRAGFRTNEGIKSTQFVSFDYSAPPVRGLVR